MSDAKINGTSPPVILPTYCMGEACTPPPGWGDYGKPLVDVIANAYDAVVSGKVLHAMAEMGSTFLREVSTAASAGCGAPPEARSPAKSASTATAPPAAPVYHGQDFRGRDFRNAVLDGVVFEFCDLRGADFRGASLNGTKFTNSRFGYHYTQDGAKRTRFDDTSALRQAVVTSGGLNVAQVEYERIPTLRPLHRP